MFPNMYRRIYYLTIVENVRDNTKQDMRYINTIGKRFAGVEDSCMERISDFLVERYGSFPRGRYLYHKVPETSYNDAIKGDEVIGVSHSYWKKDGEGQKSLFHTDCIYMIWCYAAPEGHKEDVFDTNFIKAYGE